MELRHLSLARIIAEQLLHGVKGRRWIHGAPDNLSTAIDAVAHDQRLVLTQTTSKMAKTTDPTFYRPYESKYDVQDIRPKGLQSFAWVSQSAYGWWTTGL